MIRNILAVLLLLLAGSVFAQDTLQVTVASSPIKIAYADIIVVQATSTGKALIFYGSTYNNVVTDEDYEVVTAYTTCGLLSFTERTTGLRQAVSHVNVDTVLNQTGYALIRVQPVFFVSPSTYPTVESYTSVFADKYDCGAQGDVVLDAENIGYGRGVFLDKDRQSLRFKSLVPGDGITITPQATTLLISATGGGGGGDATNLSNTPTATTVVVESSTGANTTLPAATGSFAGVMTAAQSTKLTGVETGATADQTPAEIESAYGSVVGQVSPGEIAAGTQTALRTYSPADIKSFVDTHGGAGGGSASAFLSLASGQATFDLAYTGASAPTLTSPGTGTYTIVAPAGTHVYWINAKANTNTLTGSSEYVFKFDNTANAAPRRLSVEYNSSTGSLFSPYDFGMNYTQTISSDLTTITIPNGSALGSNGFWLIMN